LEEQARALDELVSRCVRAAGLNEAAELEPWIERVASSHPSLVETPAAVQTPKPPADRDAFVADMIQLRDAGSPMFSAMMVILRLAAPERSTALRLLDRAMSPPPPTGLVAEALALFDEITDPAIGWAVTEESIDVTIANLVLKWISFGDRDRAARFLSMLLSEHASEDEQRDVLAALKRDRDEMLKCEALESRGAS